MSKAPINSRKSPAETKHLVWRISEAAPMGEWVDKSAPAPRQRTADPDDLTQGSWFSSFDLLDGASVDDGHDTVPDELFDELFNPDQKAS